MSKGITKKGKNYFIDYRNAAGKRIIRKVGESKAMAEQYLHKLQHEKTQEKLMGVKAETKMTLKEFMPKYLKYSVTNKKKKAYARDRSCSVHLLAFFGEYTLCDIKPSPVEEYKAMRIEKVENRTVNIELTTLRAMLNRAVDWEIIKENPMKKVKKLPQASERIRYLTNEEIPRLLSCCAAHIFTVVVCALYTGMRKGEILGLKWIDVDLEHDIIHVEETLEEETTKTGERRDVPLSPILKEELLKMERNGEYIFPVGDFRKAWISSLKRAGITDFKFHDLRHTFASHLVMNGETLVTVKELLGHKSIEMTMKYAHLAPDARENAIKRLSEKWQWKKNEMAPQCYSDKEHLT